MKVGDRVRVLRVPSTVEDDGEFQTRTILEKCLGKTFPVMDVNPVGMIGLEVGEVIGKAAYTETIWIEPDCLEVVESSS